MATQGITIKNRDRIQNAFDEFKTQKSLLTNCIQQWENLSTHFTSLQQSLLQKTQTLDTKIETLDISTKKSLAKISHRENSISPEHEHIAITLIQEQKQTVLKEIIEKGGDCNRRDIEEALKFYCKRMDCKGLFKYILNNKRKESGVASIRSKKSVKKLGVAIHQCCVDPYRFVLDGIEDYLDIKQVNSDKRWACGSLIQGLFPDLDGNSSVVVATSVKERAGVIAEAWKEKMDNLEEGGGDDMGRAAEAGMFLQMVVGYGLKGKFEEFLKKLVLEYPSRKEMPRLAAALGFGDKMADVIVELVKNGKEIEAVDFAFECGMTERFPPVPSLRAYLKNSRKNAEMLKNGSAAQSEAANALELNSLKAIIRCVQEHKLEAEFTLDNLIKRVSQLEKAMVDRLKSVPVGNKPQIKRSRGGHGGSGGGGGGGSGPPYFRPAKAGRSSNTYSSFSRRKPVPYVHHPHPAAGYSGPYNYPNQPMYDVPPSTSYGGSYVGGHSRSPAAALQTYTYQPEDMAGGAGVALSSVAPYTPQPPVYGGYDYIGAAAAATYQPSFPQ